MGLADYIKLGGYGYKLSEIKDLTQKGIDTSEVLRLAENGYSAADVSELITLAGAGEQVQPGNDGHNDQPGPTDPQENKGAAAESEYKAQIEAQAKEIEELKKKQAEIQMQNSSRNLAGAADLKTPREQFQEALRGLY